MIDPIYEVFTGLLPSVIEVIFRKVITNRKAWLVLGLPAFSLGIISHANLPSLVEPEWLSEREKQIACQYVSKLSAYGDLPCYSVGELKQAFSNSKSQAISELTDGTVALSPDAFINLGNVYIVAKSRSTSDFATSPGCENGSYCLRRTFDLGQNSQIKDTLTGETFNVDGLLAVELSRSDHYLVSTHLANIDEPAYVAFVGYLSYRDYIPTRRGVDTLAFVLRLHNAKPIIP